MDALPHLSKTFGIGGELKLREEDFTVEEITLEGEVLELGKRFERRGSGDFTHFVLQKKGWNTLHALRAVGRLLGVGIKRFGYAGTKDRRAVTTQLCSAWRVEPAALLSLSLKDISINGAWLAPDRVSLGDLLGNRFVVRASGVSEDAEERVAKIAAELGGIFPNYFGEQRFGTMRSNTHIVGKLIVANDFRGAVLNYLCFVDDGEMEDAREARRRLSEEMDFAKALEYFPSHLKYERLMLNHLARNPNDFVNAMRKLPRGLSLMFVHAYQSWLFNEMLAERVRNGRLAVEKGDFVCPANSYGFPDVGKARRAERAGEEGFLVGRMPGYETEELTEEESALFEREGITPKSFLIKSFPEISSRGVLRAMLAPFKEFWFRMDGKDGIFSFSLPAGSYATVLLREFMDLEK